MAAPVLYSYCIPYDDGAAPNPFWGYCTLAICKPRIRKAAVVGDWIVGTGSRNSPVGDIAGQVVYAMCVTEKMTLRQYDAHTTTRLPEKRPNWNSSDDRRRAGDSIYDYSHEPPTLRPGVHDAQEWARDHRGEYALLSDDFYYFGDHPVALPHLLLPIVRQGQGHRSRSNAAYVDEFVRWVRALGYWPGTIAGRPQKPIPPPSASVRGPCSTVRLQAASEDEALPEDDC